MADGLSMGLEVGAIVTSATTWWVVGIAERLKIRRRAPPLPSS